MMVGRRGRGRTRLSVRLRPRKPQRLHWVWLAAVGVDGRTAKPVLVRID